MQSKPRSIEIVEFRDELLPSGRKLLHCLFKDKFGTSQYVWIPPWKGDFGVERLFFKALETEQWNDYDGAWSKELKQASKEIPSLEEIRLPVKIRLGEIAEEVQAGDAGVPHMLYRVAIGVLSDEEIAWKQTESGRSFMCIGDVKISWDLFRGFLLKQAEISGVPNALETASEWHGDQWDGERTSVHGNWENAGVRFYVWLKAGLEKIEYEVIGRDIASRIRSFIRKRLSDHKSLKRGFEEQ